MQDSSKVNTKTFQWSLDIYLREGKGQKVKFTLEQDMKAQRERRYNSTLSVTLDEGGWSSHATAPLTPGKRPGTHCTGDWMGPMAGLDGWGKSRL